MGYTLAIVQQVTKEYEGNEIESGYTRYIVYTVIDVLKTLDKR